MTPAASQTESEGNTLGAIGANGTCQSETSAATPPETGTSKAAEQPSAAQPAVATTSAEPPLVTSPDVSGPPADTVQTDRVGKGPSPGTVSVPVQPRPTVESLLPKELHPNGKLAKLLAKYDGPDGDVNRWDAFNTLAKSYYQLLAAVNSFRDYRKALTTNRRGSRPTDLLQYCAWRNAGFGSFDISDVQNVVPDYVDHKAGYEHYLGDFIPPDLRECAEKRLSTKAYDNGLNPNSLADWPCYSQSIKDRRNEPAQVWATGYPAVDAAIGGSRGVTLLAGPVYSGKRTLAINLAMGVLKNNPTLAVGVFAFNMNRTTFYDRAFSLEAGIDYSTLLQKSRPQDVEARLMQAEDRLKTDQLPRLRVIETLGRDVYPNKHADMIIQHLTQLRTDCRASGLFAIFDRFRLLPSNSSVCSDSEIEAYQIEVLREVERLAHRITGPVAMPILVLHDIRGNSTSLDSARDISDLLGSRQYAYAAETILLLESNGLSTSGRVPVTLRVAKGREGITGTSIPLIFEPAISRFSEGTAEPAKPAQGQGQAASKPKAKPAKEKTAKTTPKKPKAVNAVVAKD